MTLSESQGVRYLHFGTEWVQGAMRLAQPFRLELEYQQHMMAPLLFEPKPERVLQLGLGAAALTKFCYRHLGARQILAVDIDPMVIGVARQWFALPQNDARLCVLQADARAFLRRSPARTDWLHVDLYDAQARGPVYDDVGFYRACRAALRDGGIGVFNLFGRSLSPSLAAISAAFGRRWLRMPRTAQGNHVVLAFAGTPVPCDGDVLHRRAQTLERRFGWPARAWLREMRGATGRRLGLDSGSRMIL
ncbi:MAG TPA: spermidine synthase [Burkholderiaceae bacterium]|nr:spermidine synthase [Burkholderiaceae bacterium]